MAAVWEQRFSRALKQQLDLRESTGLEALPDLMPMLPVLDASDPSLLRARDEILCSGVVLGSAIAANYLLAGLSCDLIDVVGIVERVIISNPNVAALWVNAGIATTLGTVHTQGVARDTRERATRLACFTTLDNDVAAVWEVPTVFALRIPAGESVDVPLAVVLTQPNGLQIETTAVNVGLHVVFHWRERRINASER